MPSQRDMYSKQRERPSCCPSICGQCYRKL
uniref:Uncharacterized protein n=1 Tax=Anguilla anguilla TaxID=7936 RepID=A0A0E9W6Y1_ANGAN